MTLFKRAWPTLNWFKTTGTASSQDPGMFSLGGGAMTDAGVSVNGESAMGVSAVFAAVNTISEVLATLPVYTIARYPNARYPRPNPKWTEDVTPEDDWLTFISSGMVGLLLEGMLFAYRVRDKAGTTQELWLQDPRSVGVDRDANGRRWITMGNETYSDDNFLVIKGLTLPGQMRGMSVISYARQMLGGALAVERHGHLLWANAATPRVLVTSDEPIEDSVAESIANRLDKLHSGQNAHKTAVLGGAKSVTTLTMSNEDAQFLQTREFNVAEIARWFRMPPHLLGDLSHATYSNIEQQYMQFSTLTLSPWVRRLESGLRPLTREWAVANARDANFDWRVKFSMEGLKRGDSQARAALYSALRNNGALSPNEIRELEDLNPYQGGDSHYMNAAYAQIGKDGKLLTPEPKGAPKKPKASEEDSPEDVFPES